MFAINLWEGKGKATRRNRKMVVPAQTQSTTDEFSSRYAELIESSYDCIDRIVLNAYNPLLQQPGGFRFWWRQWKGSDEGLETMQLMRIAGRYGKRVRAYAEAHKIPVIECDEEVRKHALAEEHLPQDATFQGVFLILVSRFSAPIWEVQSSKEGKVLNLVRRYAFVKQYWFHILDPEWGHLTIRISPHPPFGAQVFLNGHEYVARHANRAGLTFEKESNCFTKLGDAAALAQIADTLGSTSTIGQLRQVCERWIYSTCLHFALSATEQSQTHFQYQYSVYQVELSRNLNFLKGGQMEQLFESLVDRLRPALTLERIKTIFGAKHRPFRHRGNKPPRLEAVVETPAYNLTVFKLHFGSLTLKVYSKGEHTLRFEVIVHNTKHLPVKRSLDHFAGIIAYLRPILSHFLNTLQAVDAAFIGDDLLDRLPTPAQLGQSTVAGIHLDQPRMRTVFQAVMALAPSPDGFAASHLAAKVREIAGPAAASYAARQAAYDLKKLRAKQLVQKLGNSRKYTPTASGLSALAALTLLREKVIKPVLAGVASPKPGTKPNSQDPLDQLYHSIQLLFHQLFRQLGFAL
jgi:hypothetical protein